MGRFVWVLQGFLAVVFVLHGFLLLNPPEMMLGNFSRLPFSRGFMGFIGVAELLGALGLILPRALGVWPWLTPLAAACLTVIMLGAVGTHVSTGDVPGAVPSLVIGLLCAVTAYTLGARPEGRALARPRSGP